jgi:hypothetical protein
VQQGEERLVVDGLDLRELDLVETVKAIARTLPEDDECRVRLLAVSSAALADEGTIRPVIAARRLGRRAAAELRSSGGGRWTWRFPSAYGGLRP